ncbi:hypothetical protein [Planctomicrobium piriforme]|uniref:Uncharacterized protein n=1 Tax=Planctomicrobium piriforme TaxID=1576369 RepID=A0A1I3MXD0_9PLAN|nr:hypothetical protein [Planctomicrobium piriforme]SFJ01637.1 hypothetical protein SAMN05421753_114138 [Planctomicrobium piriforme]
MLRIACLLVLLCPSLGAAQDPPKKAIGKYVSPTPEGFVMEYDGQNVFVPLRPGTIVHVSAPFDPKLLQPGLTVGVGGTKVDNRLENGWLCVFARTDLQKPIVHDLSGAESNFVLHGILTSVSPIVVRSYDSYRLPPQPGSTERQVVPVGDVQVKIADWNKDKLSAIISHDLTMVLPGDEVVIDKDEFDKKRIGMVIIHKKEGFKAPPEKPVKKKKKTTKEEPEK